MTLKEYLDEKKRLDPKFEDKDFALKIGITKDHLSRIKRGKLKPSFRLAMRMQKESRGKLRALKLLEEENG